MSDALPPTAGPLVGLHVGLVVGQRVRHVLHLQSGGGDLLCKSLRFSGHGLIVVAGSWNRRPVVW